MEVDARIAVPVGVSTRAAVADAERRGVPRPSHPGSRVRRRWASRMPAPVRALTLVGGRVRCLLTATTSSSVVEVDRRTGDVVRRTDALPRLTTIRFAPTGWGLGITRTAAVGRGPTHLTFLDSQCRVVTRVTLPDASSSVAPHADGWYVGCRNGHLWAFDWTGRPRWSWETPGCREHNDDPYGRPCPYLVAARGDGAVVSSFGDIYAVGPKGTDWHVAFPPAPPDPWCLGIEGARHADACRLLGVMPENDTSTLKSAYRTRARATHPDRHPDDPNAAATFAAVHRAYRQLTAEGPGPARPREMTATMTIATGDPTVSVLATTEETVLVGSSDGRLARVDPSGRLHPWVVVGGGVVRAARHADGSLGAVVSDGALSFVDGDAVVSGPRLTGHLRGLVMVGDRVGLWNGQSLWMVDGRGQVEPVATLSAAPTRVVADRDGLICAHGRLLSAYA